MEGATTEAPGRLPQKPVLGARGVSARLSRIPDFQSGRNWFLRKSRTVVLLNSALKSISDFS